MPDETTSEVIAGIRPSAPRRVFGTGVLYALGLLLLYVAATNPPSILYAFLLLGFGVASLYGGYRMWEVTGRMIELTEQALQLSDGTVICRTEDIQKVDRSFFAFKPSNGFLVTTKVRYPFKWAPGLWWRFGKRIGIGGVTPGSQGKFMADTLSALVAQRDGQFKELDL